MTRISDFVGMRSLAVHFPKTIKTNDYYKSNYPESVAKAEQSFWSKSLAAREKTENSEEVTLWREAIQPYLADPFRGTVERRVLGLGESTLTMEYAAACDALEAAQLSPAEIDLIIVSCIFPEQIVPGDAAFLAQKLDINTPAWNLDSTCSSTNVAYHTACSLVKAGEYRNVLVVMSTAYTRFTDEEDPFAWWLGDGAGAFIVSSQPQGQGILGTKFINTAETCGAFFTELTLDGQNKPKLLIRASQEAGRQLRETTVSYVRECCQGAAVDANVTLDQIDFFIFSTPTAWYTEVCSKALGIDSTRTINVNPLYANIGPVLPLANLYHAAASGKIRENDLVLVYAIGSVSNAGAVIMRWGDVALGTAPAPGLQAQTLVSIG
ncbi:3-oxoacyl-[acyl-carrier-protein] synthase III C-terminal domain-containing protein [Moorena sp. SIO4G3]|uniref:3-oxoacyl-ACP synthase III family protein n=1 Tax=Moorena sp. SIO4G3 TaxID=2607821 RepID=UPI00142CE02F|nr:3-oxoacyl-[acyl-carrier-protein] synthase III C-terminal domain-containing protein [Moorena sp. SIO4G3]NEO80020.1 3-oxoacyl-ACP synthase [Moorena sp. SIO4G3]